MDPRERFTHTVEDYDRYRPNYPQALFDWLMTFAELSPGDVVIDVGCGTGISSRQLAAMGLTVIAADPNPAMLETARSRPAAGVSYVETDGERLAVPVDRCAAIVGGQSFHWLDLSKARPRFAALTDGWVVPFWNLRQAGHPFMDGYEALLHRWSPEYLQVSPERRAWSIQGEVGAETVRFSHYQDLDQDGLFGRVWSSSYIRNVVKDRIGFNEELRVLFEQHHTAGQVRLEYQTVALPFRACTTG